jgi:membrane fusion protein (multidrug efflux system)
MSMHFSHTRRTLAADNTGRSLVAFVAVAVLLAAWTAWFVVSRVAVYAASTVARVEVDREKHPVDAPVGGRVVTVRFAVGQTVKAGDVLVELDAMAERLARNEKEARLRPAASQLEALKEELAAQERALEEDRRSGLAAVAESEAKIHQMTTAAGFAAEEAKRLSRLERGGLVSEMDGLRVRHRFAERESEAQSAELAAQRLRRELETRQHDRVASIARLKREVADLEGTRTEARAAAATLEYSIDQHIVRAPISGTVAEITPLKIGRMVGSGDRIATIVPDGDLKIVAFFRPSTALGRIREGQIARVRLDAFPWTQYGSAYARVSSVAGEPHDGHIRVELELDHTHDNPDISFQHGLAAGVDVEVERVSPAGLVMRSVGARLRVAASQP